MGGWSGASTWMDTMGEGPSLGQQDLERTQKIFEIIFEVYLILCSRSTSVTFDWKIILTNLVIISQSYCPKEETPYQKVSLWSHPCICLLQVTLRWSRPVHKVLDFERNHDWFPSSSNIILHFRTCPKMVLACLEHFFPLKKVAFKYGMKNVIYGEERREGNLFCPVVIFKNH